jgi:carboxymethylenebutenolidase
MTWNSQRTDAVVGMVTSNVTFPGFSGDTIHGYAARPEGPGPFPGVVFVPHIGGWDEFCRESVRRLADHGFMAITPNIFQRYGEGTPEEVAAVARADGFPADASVIGDAEAAMKWLKAQPQSNGKVGITGPCSGGRASVLVASSVPGFDAVVNLWGGNVVQPPDRLSAKQPVAPIDLIPQLNAPMLGIFGNDDMNPSPDMVNQLEAALKENGKTYMFQRYEGAGHGIFYYQGMSYRPQAAIDGWNKLIGWFNQYLA